MSKTHWKKAQNTPYLGSQDLPDYKDITLTIDRVVSQVSHGLKENNTFNTAYFKEKKYKPMLINSTNAKVLRDLASSPYIEEWADLKITIYVDQVKAFGELHDALRIRKITKQSQSSKPVLNEQSEKWSLAKEKVQGGMTYESLTKHYQITKEDYNKLQDKTV